MLITIQRSIVGKCAVEMMFLLFKIAESILEPSLRLYIYESICLNAFPGGNTCTHLHEHHDREVVVQNTAARYMMYYKVLINFPAMIMVLFCGAWSDSTGRKLPILLTCFGTAMAALIYILSTNINGYIPCVPLILLGAGVRGVFGRSAIMTMAVQCYVSDNSEPDKRTQRLSNLTAMSHFGYLLGSVSAGYLLDHCGYAMVFLIVIGIETTCVLTAYVCMREKPATRNTGHAVGVPDSTLTDGLLDDDVRRKIAFDDRTDNPRNTIPPSLESPSKPNQTDLLTDEELSINTKLRSFYGAVVNSSQREESPKPELIPTLQEKNLTGFENTDVLIDSPVVGVVSKATKDPNTKPTPTSSCCWKLMDSFMALAKRRPGRERCNLWMFFLIIYIQQINKSGEADVFVLFIKRAPLSVSRSMYGYLLSANYACLGLFAFVIPKLMNCTGCILRDSTLAMIGTMCKILSLIAVSFSSTTWMLFAAGALTGPHSLTVSTVKSMISKLANGGELGKIFSLLSSGETLSNLLGTVIYTNIYAITFLIHPGLAFLVEAGMYLVMFFLVAELAISARKKSCCCCIGSTSAASCSTIGDGCSPQINSPTANEKHDYDKTPVDSNSQAIYNASP